MTATPNPLRTRLQVTLLALLFFLPFFGAYFAVFVLGWHPDGERVNYGQLVHPARPVPVFSLRTAEGGLHPVDALRGKWTLVQLLRGGCDEACRRELVLSRQTRTALNDRRERVQRVVIADAVTDLAALKTQLGADQPDLVWLRDAELGARALEFFADAPPNALLLVDPNGNWMMWYAPVAADQESIQKTFKGLQKDLNKLLRLSSIG